MSEENPLAEPTLANPQLREEVLSLTLLLDRILEDDLGALGPEVIGERVRALGAKAHSLNLIAPDNLVFELTVLRNAYQQLELSREHLQHWELCGDRGLGAPLRELREKSCHWAGLCRTRTERALRSWRAQLR